MAGVAGPMLRSDRRAGVRLLAGLLAGQAAGGVLLAVPAYLLSMATQALVPFAARLWALAVSCAVFAVADLMNRTPHVWRQVPQALVYRLPPGKLGLVWGFDLGLLFTTQKVVSLIWVAIAAGILLAPASAAGIVIGAALLGGVAVMAASIAYRPEVHWRPLGMLRRLRWGSGAATVALCFVTAVQAWRA